MLLLGGYDGSVHHTGIWQLKEDIWTRIGELKQVNSSRVIQMSILYIKSASSGSVLYVGRSVYFYSGKRSPYANQRLDLSAQEELTNVEVIGNHGSSHPYTVLYQTTPNKCV